MAGFKITKIEDLSPGAVDGASLFAISDGENTLRVTGGQILAFIGGMPQSNLTATVNPTAADDSLLGYVEGSMWYNKTIDSFLICEDATEGAAVWAIAGGGAHQDIDTADSPTFDSLTITNNLTVSGNLNDSTRVRSFIAGETLAINDTCYLNSDGKMWKTDASAVATSSGLVAMATEVLAADDTGTFMLYGESTGYAGLTPGAIYYIGLTAGQINTTVPAVTGEIVRVVGYALNATTVLFDPSKTWIELA